MKPLLKLEKNNLVFLNIIIAKHLFLINCCSLVSISFHFNFFLPENETLEYISTHKIHVKYIGAYFKTRFTWNHMKYFTWISCETRFTRGDFACVCLDFYPCVVYQKLTTLLKFQSVSSDNFMVSSASPQQSEKIMYWMENIIF